MNRIYDHEKLCLHKKMVIPQNIRLGQMITELLNGVSPKLLKNAIISLKKEYLEEHDDKLNTKEKKTHIQNVLDKIAAGKYNFAQQNIIEGEKFNQFYRESEIPLPVQRPKDFQCPYCSVKFFRTKASLYSHFRACSKKSKTEENLMEEQMERSEGFRPVQRRQSKQAQKKPKKVLVEIIQLEKEQEEKKQKESKYSHENKFKRDKPVSTYSFGSDIFFEE